MAKKSRKQKVLDLALPIYQVKITLQHVHPPIWRRVQLNDCSLDELHDMIQVSMGWGDEHMYAFVIDKEQFGNPKQGSQAGYDSRYVRLSEVVEEGHTRFRYDYDFGDDWLHTIDIERTMPGKKGVRYPRCVKGARACPPENCGGPFRYFYFLEELQDPEHEEDEDDLEWVGHEFDPADFDLDEVNERLRHLRRWLGKRKAKYALEAAFAKGDWLRVKPEVTHDEYPDIPLGGWVGKVKKVRWLTPIVYVVHWTKPTLKQVHSVFLKRCQRDEIKPSRYLLEEDLVEKASDPTPVAMEQPVDLIRRPLSADNSADRIRMVFGLTSDDGLPAANDQMQQHFLEYLKTHLSFPFEAAYWPTSAPDSSKSSVVIILGFADPTMDCQEGIVCAARKGEHAFQVPLSGLQVEEKDPNFQYVEDYTCWLCEVYESPEND